MKRVVIESPYAGEVERNLRYLRACLRDALLRGESPYASHGLLTQEGVLDDAVSVERSLGITAGFAWREVATLTAFYVDLGWSNGMQAARLDCIRRELPYEERSLGGEWSGSESERP